MKAFRSFALAGAALLVGALLAPATAQQIQPERFLSSGGDPSLPDKDLTQIVSQFNLRAQGDEAVAGTRSNGTSANCIQNISLALYFSQGCASPQYTRGPDGSYRGMYFDFNLGFAAPPSDMPSVIDPIASGLKGGGYTANFTALIAGFAGGSEKLWASDRSGSQLLNFGVKTTDDASCTNYTGARNAFIRTGYQVLPSSDCPPTYPPTGWMGRRLIEEDSYVQLQAEDPAFQEGDPFAFWRVPEDLQRTDKFIGDWQVYGEWNDYYFQVLPRYGAVIPGQAGAPEYSGWPMGLEVFFDAFYFGLPTLGGTTYWQATLVNNSAEVYGQGFDYDSIYFGLNYDPLGFAQSAAEYLDPARSTILLNITGNGCVNNPNPPGSSCSQTRSGFEGGAHAITVLKSPLGDMRYKLLSDAESPFFSPGHALAGDTITVNHMHMCGYGGCYPNTLARSQRAAFGLVSSTGNNVLDGRSLSDLSAGDYHRIFRPDDWPNRDGEFNKYVPGVDDGNGIWDYNHDGVPDTIYADNCARNGCVANWSDTLPSGYTMNYGNISMGAIGPFALAAGDTVGIVLALTGAPDSAGIESGVNNAIDFYQRFFLGPEAAPAPTIVGVDVETGSTRDAEVTLFWNNVTEDWRDPFLSSLDVSGDEPLNPFLSDTLGDLATDNVAAIHIFRSCDNGNSYSDDSDCDGDPANDPTGKWAGFGWQPYSTLEADEDGNLPNQFRDTNVTAGITYTYVLITETRGAVFNLVRAAGAGFAAEEVTFAPKLLSSLSASTTNPNVASVYIPLTLAGGASRANVEIISRTGVSDIPGDITVISTASQGGTYKAIIVDSVVVRQVETIEGGQVTATNTTVTGYLVRTNPDGETVIIREYSFTRSGDVSTSGLDEEEVEDSDTQRVTEFTGGQTLLLVTESGTPLLATATLDGDDTTPGTFIGRPDFPFFTISVDASEGGRFTDEFFLTGAGDTIAGNAEPSVTRLAAGSEILDGSQFGTYELTWDAGAFGRGAPFRIDLRGTVVDAFRVSMEERAVASTSSTDPAALEAVKEADPSVTLDASELVAYNLPFEVRNATYNRPVQVVVTQHQDSILLGQGFDTIRVAVPGNNWVPGDVMYFVEEVTREVTENGGTVIGPDGQPVTETVLVATNKITIGCLQPRAACDPTIGGRELSGFAPTVPGTRQMIQYLVPFSGGEELTFRIAPALLAKDVTTVTRAQLNQVHVVPNPYIVTSAYERATADRVLKFTGLPPQGRIRIYDVTGRFIQELNYTPEDLAGGDLNWDMLTREGLELAYGLYMFVLDADGERASGKFVVIR